MTNPVSDADSEDSSEDSTDRVAEVTETWESSALTEPESAMDPSAKGLVDHGDTETDEDREAERVAQRPDF